ncbi:MULTISPECIES: ABC transporter permease [Gemella]|uniref:ABC transporter permease n=1 Tax=Gemella TaxID=1378 RepID=UPI000767E657|nr:MULTISPECIES: FtsX-like permease family protein [Gemella]AME09408.1 ABC transporter permease [Gemella sp. oral taxon 928]AXI27044.1 ABC transporter permease [Gemella sp. ND 6198]
MSITKRAWNYISRKKVKTVLIFLILTLISTALLSSFSIMFATNKIEKKIYEISNTGFTVVSKNVEQPITLDAAKKFLENKKISKYNFKYDTLAKLTDKKVVDVKQNVTIDESNSKLSNLVSIFGTTDTKLEKEFTSGVFKLEKGNPITEKDNSKVLIHEKLAQKNNLKVGDKIKLRGVAIKETNTQESSEVELEVAGIFSGQKNEKNTGLSSDATENTIFTDYNSSQKLWGYKANDYKVTTAVYFLSNPNEIDSAVDTAKKTPIDWNGVDIVKNNKDFEAVSSSVINFKNIIDVLTLGIIIGSVVVLSLILMFWLRERIYEIGILLSLGISKIKIIAQFIIELMIISVFSIILSSTGGNIVAKYVFKEFINNGQFEDGSTSIFESVIPKLDFTTIISTYGILILIILISVIGTSYIILHKKPKDILSNMS